MTMLPRSGLSKPMRHFRKTDFPVPDGPSNTLTSPGGRVNVTSDQMFVLPNDLLSPLTATSSPANRHLQTGTPPARRPSGHRAGVWIERGDPASGYSPVTRRSHRIRAAQHSRRCARRLSAEYGG